jgi:hypothetical protein
MSHSSSRLHTLLPPKGSPVVEPPLLLPVAESPEVVGGASVVEDPLADVEASVAVTVLDPSEDSEPPLSPPQAGSASRVKASATYADEFIASLSLF